MGPRVSRAGRCQSAEAASSWPSKLLIETLPVCEKRRTTYFTHNMLITHYLHRNSQHPLIVLHLIPPIICSCRGDHDFVAKEANFFVTHNIDSSVLPHFGFAKRFQGPDDGLALRVVEGD